MAPRAVQLNILRDGRAVTVGTIGLAQDASVFQRESLRWRYIVRQRHRWSQDPDSIRSLEIEAQKTLSRLGVRPQQLWLATQSDPIAIRHDDLPFPRLLEVRIPWRHEQQDWHARIMPWEHLLSSATREHRCDGKLVIVRHLVIPRAKRSSKPPSSFSILDIAPQEFERNRPRESERRLVDSSLQGLRPISWPGDHAHPSIPSLGTWLMQNKPSVMHIMGIDASLGLELQGEENHDKLDGIFMQDASQNGTIVSPLKVAELLSSGKPHLIGYNVWNAAPRIAALSVVQGAEACLAFEHTFDASVAKRFFAHFYRTYRDTHWNLAFAFSEAILATRPYADRIRGSSIVLWSRTSLIEQQIQTWKANGVHSTTPGLSGLESLATPQRDRHSKELVPVRIADVISVEVETHSQLNYASLHNRASLLKKLALSFDPSGFESLTLEDDQEIEPSYQSTRLIKDIRVQVTLDVAGQSAVYRAQVNLGYEDLTLNLADPALQATENHPRGGIHVPLHSEWLRSIDELTWTSIHVLVQWRDQCIHEGTHAVRIAPSDEWRLNDDELVWLPSFVQPRDPAVPKIVDAAQRYLQCLTDCVSSGFNGYQCYQADQDDPWQGIDFQVQAIWNALTLEFPLKYINPPPSYSNNTQRLRMPSQVLREGRGTCIDLSMLLAACLEWIEIFPVMIQFYDHACPGYWRSSEAYQRFWTMSTDLSSTRTPVTSPIDNTSSVLFPWYSDATVYSELRAVIAPVKKSRETASRLESRCGLVPLESVCLTHQSGFGAAKLEARKYFSQSTNPRFHSLIDISKSRSHVTPLPLTFRT